MSGKKILVVEDDPHLRRVFRALLENEDFVVLEAKDGAEGLSAALDHLPDCIISDSMMPRLNGVAMLMELKSKGVRIPSIIVSAAADLPPRAELTSLGVTRVLGKPFPFDQLIEIVRKATEG